VFLFFWKNVRQKVDSIFCRKRRIIKPNKFPRILERGGKRFDIPCNEKEVKMPAGPVGLTSLRRFG
jgi:hypothetical protein